MQGKSKSKEKCILGKFENNQEKVEEKLRKRERLLNNSLRHQRS